MLDITDTMIIIMMLVIMRMPLKYEINNKLISTRDFAFQS